MAEQSKYQIEIDAFKNNFRRFKNKKIVIYGIGRRTATLLLGINEFHVIGLLDKQKENVGITISGIPVISIEEAEEKADLIIINSDPTNYYVIYKRISCCKIPVYYANGEKARLKEMSNDYELNPYWDSSKEDAKKMIDNHDVVSFDLFDTLIMRQIYLPQDVFRLVEKQINEKYNININFAVERQMVLREFGSYEPSLDDIYDKLQKKLKLSCVQTKLIKETEIETEKKLCVPRREVIELFRYAQEQNKQIYIITDMYLPKSVIIGLLKKCNITDIKPENIWVSCEMQLTKSSSLVWDKFRKHINSELRILHFGDNIISDIKQAQKYEIDTYFIMSAKEMLENSSISELSSYVISLKDAVHMGLLISKLYNSPFELNKRKGKLYIKDCDTFGYSAFGALFTGFIFWLYNNVKKQGTEELLFFARDGYFLQEDFKYVQEKCFKKQINTKYLPLSRRLMYMITIENEEDLKKTVEFPYIGSFKDYMYSRFNITVTDDTKEYNELQISASNDAEKIMCWLKSYRTDIIEELKREKDNYKSYLDNNIDVLSNSAIVDLGYYGTTQYCLSKFTERKYDGYYFYACLSDDNPYIKTCNMKACYNGNGIVEGNKGLVGSKSAFLESFLTAPYGMIRYIDDNANIVCEPDKMNQKNFNKKRDTNDGVKSYIDNFVDIYGPIMAEEENSIEAYIYNILVGESCDLSDDVLDGFYFDNDMVGGRELRLGV